MEHITGTITALSSKTWKETTRTVKPFSVSEDMPWVDVVDMAIENTFPEDHFEQHEDDLRSAIPAEEEDTPSLQDRGLELGSYSEGA